MAAQIRRNPLKPDKYILSLFEENLSVELIDFPGYTGVVDFLEYLMPLLYKNGIYEYDLWFIPEDGLEQANAILGASRFFTQSAAELIGQVSYLYQFKEYVDFLEAIYEFNKTLPAQSPPVKLVADSANHSLKLSQNKAKTKDTPKLYIQSPLLFDFLYTQNSSTLYQKLKQVSLYLGGGENLYVINEELSDFFPVEDKVIIMLKEPGTISPCQPYEGGINRENFERALEDFPNINITAPWAAVPLMKRAQKRFLKELAVERD